jgi:hypothetical protein
MTIKIFIITTMLSAILFVPHSAFAKPLLATCSGTGCNGTDPGNTGCGGSGTTLAMNYPASTTLELRFSTGCHTYWSRSTNMDAYGRSFYANATLWPQGYSVSSPAPIAVYSSVYSQQQYKSGTGTNGFNACGYVSGSYIYPPVSKSASCAPSA